jgi:conjugative transfer region lipoprotein (TIGR03751 family)
LLATVLISGCSIFSDKDSILPQEGLTMQEVYRGHFAGDTLHAARHNDDDDDAPQQPIIQFGQRPIHADSVDLKDYTRSAANDIETRFVRLPNPTLALYVFPHLGADQQYPVPGYSTLFPLYKQVYYALPGELEPQP